ncbi:MAG TPA: N-acetyl-gamma-glutamyl-phosphate reductase [Gemmatimonas sp.]|uniref:N-acetyl-gamma-glutamyl-phosphate reductase n=1 Tax=Gemmatimonas sp. TaxID=1962908 RepID=UPI002ED861C4
MPTYRVGVLGASGYSGRELCALVLGHPQLSLAFATAHSQRGTTLRVRAGGTVHDIPLIGPEEADLAGADLVFAALPHGASAEWVARVIAAGARVVDLSSDLRPGHGGTAHGLPEGVPADAPYGLPELFREPIRNARVVANPGCYATSVLVALAPLAKAGLIAPGAAVNIAAASGISGAGASPKLEYLFAEVTENYRAYGVGNSHRHLFEMRDTMSRLGADCDLLFTPHLLPVDRGILSTITVPLSRSLSDPLEPYRAMFADEPFVELTKGLPALADVQHRNVVRIGAVSPTGMRQPTLLVFSAIDNLVKGAAGQAVQNANLMLGLPEAAGLQR